MAAAKKVKIDCTKELVDIDGEVIKFNGKDATVGRLIAVALRNSQDKKDADKMLDLYELSMNIANSESYDLSDAELRDIEKAVMTQSTIIGGQIIKYLRDCKSESRKK